MARIMKHSYTTSIIVLALFICTTLRAQTTSWVRSTPGATFPVWDPKWSHGLAVAPSTGATVLFPIDNAKLRTYDWQGVMVEERTLPAAHSLRSISDGSMVMGTFQGSMEIGGITLQGGTANADAYVARLNAEGDPLWATHSVTMDSQGLVISRFAVAPNGRSVIHLVSAGAHRWGGDTVLSDPGDRLLIVLDNNGSLAWYKRLGRSTSFPSFMENNVEVAINDAGDVWIAAILQSDLVIEGDTIPCGPTYASNQFVAHFSTSGELLSHRTFIGSFGQTHLLARSISAWPDGRLFMGGFYRNGLDLGDTVLTAPNTVQGLLLEFDPALNILGYHPLRSQGSAVLTAITADPTANRLLLSGILGRDASFGGSSMDIDAESVAFAAVWGVNDGLEQWSPMMYTNDVLNGSIWPLNIVAEDHVVHVNGSIAGTVRRMNGTVIPSNGFLARVDLMGHVGLGPVNGDELPVLRCWPSPTPGDLHVEFAGNGAAVAYRILALDGRLVGSGQWPSTTIGKQVHYLALEHLPHGTYLLSVVQDRATSTTRFIRQ